MSPSRTGGSQSTTYTGPAEGEEIESFHINITISLFRMQQYINGLKSILIGYMQHCDLHNRDGRHNTIHIIHAVPTIEQFHTVTECVLNSIQRALSHTHSGVDHVWSLCSCCLDCLEDVHSSFNFDSLNFRHTSNEHTTARHTVTGDKEGWTWASCAVSKESHYY